MSRTSGQVDIRNAYQPPSTSAASSIPHDTTRPATARFDVTTPARVNGSTDTRPARPSSAHTRLLTTYGATGSSPKASDAVITKQDLRRKRGEEYLSERIRQIYGDVGRDTNRPKRNSMMFQDMSGRPYKGENESLQDTIHALKYQLQQESDKRTKLAARCRRLEQVVAMKDKKLEEALAMHAQHSSYNSYQRELANRERTYNNMLGKLREKIDQQTTTIAAYEDIVNGLKAGTKHTRVMEMEEALTQFAMELQMARTKIDTQERQLAQSQKQLEDRSETTAQKTVKRLRSIVLTLNEDKKRLDKENKVLKAYIAQKDHELAAAHSAALKSHPKPKVGSPTKRFMTPTSATNSILETTYEASPTPHPPLQKASRPQSAGRARPTAPGRPSTSGFKRTVQSPTRSASTPKKATQQGDNKASPAPSTPATEQPVVAVPPATKEENTHPPKPPQAHVPDVPVETTAPQKNDAAADCPLLDTTASEEVLDAAETQPNQDVKANDDRLEGNEWTNDGEAVAASEDDFEEEDTKFTTDIERILSRDDDPVRATNDHDDEDGEDDFDELMAFEPSSNVKPTSEEVELEENNKKDDADDDDKEEEVDEDEADDIATELDEVTAACKIQKIFRMYSHRRDSMELHIETVLRASKSNESEIKLHEESSPAAVEEEEEDVYSEPAESDEGKITPGASQSSLQSSREPQDGQPEAPPTDDEITRRQDIAASTIQKAYRRSSIAFVVNRENEEDVKVSAEDEENTPPNDLKSHDNEAKYDEAASTIQNVFRHASARTSVDSNEEEMAERHDEVETSSADKQVVQDDASEVYSEVAVSECQITPQASDVSIDKQQEVAESPKGSPDDPSFKQFDEFDTQESDIVVVPDEKPSANETAVVDQAHVDTDDDTVAFSQPADEEGTEVGIESEIPPTEVATTTIVAPKDLEQQESLEATKSLGELTPESTSNDDFDDSRVEATSAQPNAINAAILAPTEAVQDTDNTASDDVDTRQTTSDAEVDQPEITQARSEVTKEAEAAVTNGEDAFTDDQSEYDVATPRIEVAEKELTIEAIMYTPVDAPASNFEDEMPIKEENPPVSPSADDRKLIESVMDHLDIAESDDEARPTPRGEAPMSYEDEFLDDEDDLGDISQDAHTLAGE
ncbi:hypothetical protein AC1031_018785 [Aphanomyces cochlioides]|nr:hypothetical protein AC1031_018785 [Aphanomyces cochlioides]